MNDLYLVAHKVRGLPAFDVAIQMACAVCYDDEADEHGHLPSDTFGPGCHECDSLGFWWIIPTSGHRAYPWWHIHLDEIEFEGNGNYCLSEELTTMPPSLPDHYTTRATPKVSLIEALGIRPAPSAPIVRRF